MSCGGCACIGRVLSQQWVASLRNMPEIIDELRAFEADVPTLCAHVTEDVPQCVFASPRIGRAASSMAVFRRLEDVGSEVPDALALYPFNSEHPGDNACGAQLWRRVDQAGEIARLAGWRIRIKAFGNRKTIVRGSPGGCPFC